MGKTSLDHKVSAEVKDAYTALKTHFVIETPSFWGGGLFTRFEEGIYSAQKEHDFIGWALHNNHGDIDFTLEEMGKFNGISPLTVQLAFRIAAKRGFTKTVGTMLNHFRGSISRNILLHNNIDVNGRNPLMLAALGGHTETAKLILGAIQYEQTKAGMIEEHKDVLLRDFYTNATEEEKAKIQERWRAKGPYYAGYLDQKDDEGKTVFDLTKSPDILGLLHVAKSGAPLPTTVAKNDSTAPQKEQGNNL